MGICMRYQSIGVPDQEIKKKIMDEAVQICKNREWWAEDMYFLGAPNDGEPLHGIPKVMIYFSGIITKDKQEFTFFDSAEDGFMAARDMDFIVRQLANWSIQYRVDWELDYDGEFLGKIVSGQISQGIFDFINVLLEPMGIDLDDPIAESKAQEIFYKYPDR